MYNTTEMRMKLLQLLLTKK